MPARGQRAWLLPHKICFRIIGLAAFFVFGMGWAFGQSMPPTSYNSLTPPSAGSSYVDPVFGTSIRRLSDAPSRTNAAGSGNLLYIGAEYSTMSPFNQDNTRVLLQHQSYYALYNTNGTYIRDLPFEIHASSEPRWSRHDADTLYFVNGNQLKKHNVSTGATSVVRTFSEYTLISGKGESDISFDGDHFVFAGDNRYVFVYRISTNTKFTAFDTGGRGFDSLYITPNNNVTISWLQNGTSRYNGIEFFDRNMNFLRQVARVGGHMDVTRDTDGSEVLVWTNAADPTPICDNGIVKIRLSDARQTCLISLDWSLGTHTSAPDGSGWVFVETYAPGDPDPSGFWPAYTNEILQIKLDGSQVRRLAHHRSRPFDSYYWTPRVSSSRDGKLIAYNSNFGQQAVRSLDAAYHDAYLIRTDPATGGTATTGPSSGSGSTSTDSTGTSTDSTGSTSGSTEETGSTSGGTTSGTTSGTPVRYENDDSAITYSGTWYPKGISLHSGGAAVLAADAGARARFTFTGTGVSWLGYGDEWSGIAEIYLDGILKATVDTYRSPAQAQATFYSVSNLAGSTHTLEIRVTGRHSSGSAANWVWIDAFDVVESGSGSTSTGSTDSTGTSTDSTGSTSGSTVETVSTSGGTASGTAFGTPVRHENDDSAITYIGTWYPNGISLHSGGGAVLAADAGARARFTFTGTGVSWLGYGDEWSGIANVYLDGVLKATVDTYRSPAEAQATFYSVSNLAASEHTLEIHVTGRHSSGSAGNWVWIDAFDVVESGSGGSTSTGSTDSTGTSTDSTGSTSGSTGGTGLTSGGTTSGTTSGAPVRYENGDAAIAYSGTWYPNGISLHSGGGAALAADAGARARFTFTGTGVSWLGYGDEWSGIAEVYLDGVLKATVDTYRSPAEAQATFYSVSNLAASTHTLEIRVIGRHSSGSAANWVWIDAFDVFP